MLSLNGKFDWLTHSISASNGPIPQVPFRIRAKRCPRHCLPLIWLLPGHWHAWEEAGKLAEKFCPSEWASEQSVEKGTRESRRVVDQMAHDVCQKIVIFFVPTKLAPVSQRCSLCVVYVGLCILASLQNCANHCGSELEHKIAYKVNATDAERDIGPLGLVPSAV